MPQLAAGGGITLHGVPYDAGLFATGAPAVPAADSAAARQVVSMLGSASMKSSISAIDSFVAGFASMPDLDVLLHGPALKKGSSAAESTLPVKPLRSFEGFALHHLRAPDNSIEGFCSTLPSISAAGLAAPAADRLVRPELAEVYTQFAAGILELSRKLQGISGAAAAAGGGGCPQLRLQHFCQVTFGRLDLAWQAALEQQQQQE